MDAASETHARALVEAGIALASELSLDGVLHRLVEAAASLTHARYAALGVIDASGSGLSNFVAFGLTEDEHAAIGSLPQGRGVLGALITDGEPLRLHDLTTDPRAVGFPPHHPPMKTFLGVPVRLRGVAYGNLYLTDKAGDADFTEDDQQLVEMLAAQAAVAIENARLFEASQRWSRQLESVNEIAASLAAESELSRQLELIVDRVRELLAARLVAVALASPDGGLRVEAAVGEGLDGIELGPATKTAMVLTRGRSERVDDVTTDPEVGQELAQRLGVRSALFVPLRVGPRALGVLIAVDKEPDGAPFTDDDLRLAESFGRRAAVAVDLSQRVARDALRRAITAQEVERRRLARELHDETGQALTSILLGLREIERASGPEAARDAVERVRALVVETLEDVRRLAVELRPAALDDFGLLPALRRLGQTLREQSGLDVQVEATLGEARLPAELETAVYRIVQEALTNVVRHAHARHVSVILARKNGRVSVVVEDDGTGFELSAVRAGGLGLLGMRERAELLDGSVRVESTAGTGTTLVFDLPVP